MIIGRDQYADLQYMSHNMRFTAGKFCRVTTRDNFFPAGRLFAPNLPHETLENIHRNVAHCNSTSTTTSSDGSAATAGGTFL